MQTFFSVQTSLKEALQVIWDSLPQGPINKAVKSSTPQLKTCTKADSEHTKWLSNIRQSVHRLVSVTDLLFFGANVFQRAKIAKQSC